MHFFTEFLSHSTEWLVIIVTVILAHATYRAGTEEHRHAERIQEETTEIVKAVIDHINEDKDIER